MEMVKLVNQKETVAEKLDEIVRLLNNLSSNKSNLKAKAGKFRNNKSEYDRQMNEILTNMESLKELRRQIKQPKMQYTTLTPEQIECLDYIETEAALNSIRTKITRNRYNIDNPVILEQAQAIESNLLKHKAEIAPIDKRLVRVSQLQEMLDIVAETAPESKLDYLIETIEKLINQAK
jgi:hypothetical protein